MKRVGGWLCRLGLVLGCGMSGATPVAACSIACALTHAAGPRSWLEIVIVMPVIALVGFVLIQAVRYTFRPGEHTPDHIKWRILQEDTERL